MALGSLLTSAQHSHGFRVRVGCGGASSDACSHHRCVWGVSGEVTVPVVTRMSLH